MLTHGVYAELDNRMSVICVNLCNLWTMVNSLLTGANTVGIISYAYER
jgi:hypothetical protein